MKQLLFLLLICASSTAFSQKDLEPKQVQNEITINFYNAVQAGTIPNVDFDMPIEIGPMLGLTYTKHLNTLFFMRSGVNLRRFEKKQIQPSNWNSTGTYNELNFKLGIGIQRQLKKKFMYYFSSDIIYLLSRNTGSSGGGFTGIYTGHVINTNSFGLTPSIGFQFKITPRIKLGAESSLQLLFSNQQAHYVTSVDEEWYETKSFFQIIPNPLSALYVSFGF